MSAREGRIEEWVHDFLLAPGDNAALSQGLRRMERHWVGPVELPIRWLERCCGPEPEIEYPQDPESWARRVGGLGEGLRSGASLPPLITEYRSGRLSVRDGNHRLGAVEAAGHTTAWVLIWYNTAGDLELHRSELRAAGFLKWDGAGFAGHASLAVSVPWTRGCA